jgi:rod shape-determining protein MreC
MAMFGPSRRLFGEASLGARLPRARRIQASVFAALAVGLLAVSRVDPETIAPLSRAVVGLTAPLAAMASSVMVPIAKMVSSLHATLARRHDLEHLRAENARLTALAARVADLQLENDTLRRMANYAGQSGRSLVTALVIASSAGPLSRTVVIDAGVNRGIADGAPVVDEAMLVGRVLDVQSGSSRVMLLGDRLSRVPVQIGGGQIRAVLVGNGSEQPHLDFIANETAVTSGDLVTTSGLGGIFPRGLVIGTVSGAAQRWVVSLAPSQDVPMYVSVLALATLAAGPVSTGGSADDGRAPGASVASKPSQAPKGKAKGGPK